MNKVNRQFGIVFTIFFLILALINRGNHDVKLGLIGIAIVILLITIFCPAWLNRPNKYWTNFGLLLNKITSPVFLFLFYFVFFSPMSIIIRSFKKHNFGFRNGQHADGYWKMSSDQVTSMKDQF